MDQDSHAKTPFPPRSQEKPGSQCSDCGQCGSCGLAPWLAPGPCMMNLASQRPESEPADMDALSSVVDASACKSPTQTFKLLEKFFKSSAPAPKPPAAVFQSPIATLKVIAPPPRPPLTTSKWATGAFKPPLPIPTKR